MELYRRASPLFKLQEANRQDAVREDLRAEYPVNPRDGWLAELRDPEDEEGEP